MPDPKTPNTLPVMVMSDDWQVGFSFYTQRWSGKSGYQNAKNVRECLKSQGHISGIHSSEAQMWEAGKSTLQPYWRVYIRHPKMEDYYTWFAPAAIANWADEFDGALATWFEFAKEKAA